MNNYHSIMSRFQVPAATIHTASFNSQFSYPPAAPLQSGYPKHSTSMSNTSHSAFQVAPPQLQIPPAFLPQNQITQQQQEQQQSNTVTSVIPNVIPHTQISPSSAAPHSQISPSSSANQIPEAPKKRDSNKSIEPCFRMSKSPGTHSVVKDDSNADIIQSETFISESVKTIPKNQTNDRQASTRITLE